MRLNLWRETLFLLQPVEDQYKYCMLVTLIGGISHFDEHWLAGGEMTST